MEADAALGSRWDEIVPHLPGVSPGAVQPADGPATALLPGGVSTGDARRLLNAHLHLLHLACGTLCLHAVALRFPADGRVVVLLGGHGAGKSLVALALVRRGWRVLAGDVALVELSEPGQRPRVLGGTAAFLARRGPTLRWFPGLALPPSGGNRVDLGHLPGLRESAPVEAGPVAVAAVVDVDGDPAAGAGAVEMLDAHTAATVWWRASGHLLERLLDDSPVVLRQFEDGPAAAHRQDRVRALARALPLHAAWGAPDAIAGRVLDLADSSTPTQSMEVR
ncbi:hypothetical protein ACWECC_30930 [Streptomyces microflavus]